jgi:Fe2+ transport system protein B
MIDLPGVYSLELDQLEAEVCRAVLEGRAAPHGERVAEPTGVCIVADATNLPRNLLLVGEALRRRLPTVVAVNMIDLARKRGIVVDAGALAKLLGCTVVCISAREGEGIEALEAALAVAKIPNHTPPGTQEALRTWADDIYAKASQGEHHVTEDTLTDRVDRVTTHPVFGMLLFVAIMAGVFWTLFSLARYPMDFIDHVFNGFPERWAAWSGSGIVHTALTGGLAGLVRAVLPEGLFQDCIASGVVGGVGAMMVFLPQICLLFFFISILEDTGYLARAAFVMDRALRPFGLPGHSFMPLLSSHACALPGIMATRAIPDKRERLATILVAPFMTCSARLPVYVLVTSVLFRDSPGQAALAFVGCYALGVFAGIFSALVARRTILKGPSRPMALELPTYKRPSLRTALITTYDRGMVFVKNAGTNILAICIILWWMGAFPRAGQTEEAFRLRFEANAVLKHVNDADVMVASNLHTKPDIRITAATRQEWIDRFTAMSASAQPGSAEAKYFLDAADCLRTASLTPDEVRAKAQELNDKADRAQAKTQKAESFAGLLGKALQPVFQPLGFDWQLTVGVLTSFAAREVFVSTMSVIVSGQEDAKDEGVLKTLAVATRDDGRTKIFTPAVCWALLVYYVLAMQCLPTLAVTAKESGSVKWALLQLVWMSGIAYVAAAIVYQILR